MPSRVGILMGMVLAAGIAAPGCGGRLPEAPAGRPDARRDDQAERDDQARQDEEARQYVRMFSETLKARPTVITADGQSILVFPESSFKDHKGSVTWRFYRYENGRLIEIEVLDTVPAPPTE